MRLSTPLQRWVRHLYRLFMIVILWQRWQKQHIKQHSVWSVNYSFQTLHGQRSYQIKMASSYNTSLLASSFPIKIVPYVSRAPKSKPKPKAKLIATTIRRSRGEKEQKRSHMKLGEATRTIYQLDNKAAQIALQKRKPEFTGN